jgi:hypothetical protein
MFEVNAPQSRPPGGRAKDGKVGLLTATILREMVAAGQASDVLAILEQVRTVNLPKKIFQVDTIESEKHGPILFILNGTALISMIAPIKGAVRIGDEQVWFEQHNMPGAVWETICGLGAKGKMPSILKPYIGIDLDPYCTEEGIIDDKTTDLGIGGELFRIMKMIPKTMTLDAFEAEIKELCD